MTLATTGHDIWFYAFLATALILGWVWGRVRHMMTPLYEKLIDLTLERDAQAMTIDWQRRVIAELEKKLGAFPQVPPNYPVPQNPMKAFIKKEEES